MNQDKYTIPLLHPNSTGNQILSITRRIKRLSPFSNLCEECQRKNTALLEQFHSDMFSSRYCFMAGKPMVQAEHKHV